MRPAVLYARVRLRKLRWREQRARCAPDARDSETTKRCPEAALSAGISVRMIVFQESQEFSLLWRRH